MGRSNLGGNRSKPWELHRDWGKHRGDKGDLELVVRASHTTLAPASGVAGSGTYQQPDTPPNMYAFAAEESARRAGAAGGAGGGVTSHHSSIWKGLGYSLAGLFAIAVIGAASVYALGGRGGEPGPVPMLTPTVTATATPAPTDVPMTPAPTDVPMTPTPISGLENILSEQQIVEYATGWQNPQLITPDLLDKIDAVNKSVYHHFTGKTFEQGRYVTHLLTEQEYQAYPGIDHNSEGTIGFIMPDGTSGIFVHSHLGETISPFEILVTLAHETGNMEELKLSKVGTNSGSVNLNDYVKKIAEEYGLGDLTDFRYQVGDAPVAPDLISIPMIAAESLQALYRAAVFHYLEELGVIKQQEFTAADAKNIDDTVDAMAKSKNFFPQASLVAWYIALHDTDTSGTLQEKGKITSQQAYRLFTEGIQRRQTLVGFNHEIVEVVTAVRTAPQYAQQIKNAAHLSQRNSTIIATFVYFP